MNGTDSVDSPIAIYGAAGYTGQLVAAELERRGHPLILVGRDLEKLNADLSVGGKRVAAAVRDRERLVEVFSEARIVINCAGPFAHTGAPVLTGALDAGCHYLDTAAEQGWVVRVFDDFGAMAAERGRAAVPAVGFYYLIGDLLAGIVSGVTSPVDRVTVAYAVHGWSMTPGSRKTVEFFVGEEVKQVSYREGRWSRHAPDFATSEFEFPPPVGRQAVVAYPGGEVVTVPRHFRTDEVKTWMSFGGQAPAEGQGPSEWADNTFTVVVEGTTADRRVRAVARGRDIYGISALTVAEAVAAVSVPGFDGSGALAPTDAFGPRGMLDKLQRSGRFDFEYLLDTGPSQIG